MRNENAPAFGHGNREQGSASGLTKLEYAAIHIYPAIFAALVNDPDRLFDDDLNELKRWSPEWLAWIDRVAEERARAILKACEDES
jgi:hypothetical protein